MYSYLNIPSLPVTYSEYTNNTLSIDTFIPYSVIPHVPFLRIHNITDTYVILFVDGFYHSMLPFSASVIPIYHATQTIYFSACAATELAQFSNKVPTSATVIIESNFHMSDISVRWPHQFGGMYY